MQKLLYIALASLLILTVGCGKEEYRKENFYSMGTFVTITLPEKNFDKAIDIRAEIQQLENRVKSSTETANKIKDLKFTGIMAELMKYGEEYSAMTNGKFSVYAYTIAKLYGFHEGPYRIPSDDELVIAVQKLKDRNDVLLDTGAYSKGYIVDKSIEYIKSLNIKNAMVNAGGDLYALGIKGNRKWRVAVKHPQEANKFLSVLNLQDKALATSGDYERFFEQDGKRIFHIFDATTGKNPDMYTSVSVLADTAEKADGLATVFFLLSEDEIKTECKRFETPVLLYTRKNELKKLCGWESFEAN